MNIVKTKLITAALVASFGLGLVAVPSSVSAGDAKKTYTVPSEAIGRGLKKAGDDSRDNDGKKTDPSKDQLTDTIVGNVINMLLFIIGAVSVIMLIFGGIRYTTANGNPEQIKAAKNTVMYAIVGLIIALLAFAIINFVVTSLTKAPEPPTS